MRLRHFQVPSLPHPGNDWKLGLIFSSVGLVTVVLSTWHYFAIRYAIDEEIYTLGDRWVMTDTGGHGGEKNYPQTGMNGDFNSFS